METFHFLFIIETYFYVIRNFLLSFETFAKLFLFFAVFKDVSLFQQNDPPKENIFDICATHVCYAFCHDPSNSGL